MVYPWLDYRTLLPLCLGSTGLICFVVFELRFARHALIPISKFDQSCTLGFFAALLHGLILWCMLYYLPVYYETVKGLSITMVGVALLPETLTIVPASIITGILVSSLRTYREAIQVGWILTTLGTGLLLMLGVEYKNSSLGWTQPDPRCWYGDPFRRDGFYCTGFKRPRNPPSGCLTILLLPKPWICPRDSHRGHYFPKSLRRRSLAEPKCGPVPWSKLLHCGLANFVFASWGDKTMGPACCGRLIASDMALLLHCQCSWPAFEPASKEKLATRHSSRRRSPNVTYNAGSQSNNGFGR